MAAAREGRLFVEESRQSVSKERVIEEVRVYVRRVGELVTPGFCSSVDELWEDILACDDLVEILMPGRKLRICQNFNKYSVMRIIGVLREKGVYEQYSDRRFDALLEPDCRDSRYRRYLGMGLEQRPLLVQIRKIVAKYQV